MNKRKLWRLITVPGLAVMGLLLVFLLLVWSTANATFGLISDVEVFKSVDEPVAVPGERHIYQIVISSAQDIATAQLTDTLPSVVIWAGDITSTSGNANSSNGTITWSGPLTASVPITLNYGVTVTHIHPTAIYTDVYNDAVLDDGLGNIFPSTPAVFAIGRPFGTGSDRTFALDAGDADNDGDLDLAVGNHAPNQVCWNNGDGFDCEDAFGGSPTFDVEWGDMNGDGYLDLVVANSMGHANLVCLNNKDRTFTCTAFSYCAGPGADEVCFVALGDVDNDDDLDIALGTRFPGNVWAEDIIYYNNGDGTFDPVTGTACQGHPTLELTFGYIDNDDYLDLAVVGHYSEYVCINDGTGHFTETRWLAWRKDKNTQSVALGDANNDGYLDVAVGRESYSNEVYLNDGPNNPGYFTNKLPFGPVWDKTWDVAWGDVDNDGNQDLASGNTYQHIVVYFNEPVPATNSVSFTEGIFLGTFLSHRTNSVVFGDVDKDGDLDLATGNEWEQNVVYLNTLLTAEGKVYLPVIFKD